MSTNRRIPAALSIAGSDSGGGAGIQADLKTFASLGVHGLSAITCVTAQNPREVTAIEPCSVRMVRRQIDAVLTDFKPRAVKTGMLYSAEIIRTVARCLRGAPRLPLVVDPVMISTSGARLLEPAAVKVLCDDLLPAATLVTPNLAEAGSLLGAELRNLQDMRAAARELQRRYGCAILVKGGHLKNSTDAVDVLFDGKRELQVRARFIRGVGTHGTGCTYSAAITAFLALGAPLASAIARAKDYVTEAIARSLKVHVHTVLNTLQDGTGQPGAKTVSKTARRSRRTT